MTTLVRQAALVLGAVALVAGAGCGPRPCTLPPRADGPPGPPLLWRVQRGDGPVVWLFGTIHDAGADHVPAPVWAALDGSPRFASELGDVEPDPDRLRELTRMRHGKGLDELLPAERWWVLRDALHGVIREDDLKRARPWYAMSLLTRAVSPPPRTGMDTALLERARDRGVPVDALETWDEQLGTLGDAVSIDDLVEAIDARRTMRCILAGNRAAYAAGDLDEVTQIYGAGRSGLLIAPRNDRWLPAIEAYLTGGGAFVAVGIGHLVGPDGLVVRLAAAGYTVERAASGDVTTATSTSGCGAETPMRLAELLGTTHARGGTVLAKWPRHANRAAALDARSADAVLDRRVRELRRR